MAVDQLADVRDAVLELLPAELSPAEKRGMRKEGFESPSRKALLAEFESGTLVKVAKVGENIYRKTAYAPLVRRWAGVSYIVRAHLAQAYEDAGNLAMASMDNLAAGDARLKLGDVEVRKASKQKLYGEACGLYGKSVGQLADVMKDAGPGEMPRYVEEEYYARCKLGDSLMRLGRFDEAYGQFKMGVEKAGRAGDSRFVCFRLGFLADAALALGRFDEAHLLYSRSARHAEKLADGCGTPKTRSGYVKQACYMLNRAGKSADMMLDKGGLTASGITLWRVNSSESYDRAQRLLGSVDDSLLRRREIAHARDVLEEEGRLYFNTTDKFKITRGGRVKSK